MKIHNNYMGLKLNSAIIVSACTLLNKLNNMVEMEDYIKEIIAATTHSFVEALDYFSDLEKYNTGSDEYLENIRTSININYTT